VIRVKFENVRIRSSLSICKEVDSAVGNDIGIEDATLDGCYVLKIDLLK